MLIGISGAHAADKIRAGKAINVIWAMIPLDIGAKEGLFAKYGVDVDIITMSGGAKLQQGLIADSIDIGIDGGTALSSARKVRPSSASRPSPAPRAISPSWSPRIHRSTRSPT